MVFSMATKLRLSILTRLKDGDLSIDDADKELKTAGVVSGRVVDYTVTQKGCISFGGLRFKTYWYPKELVRILNHCRTVDFHQFFEEEFPDVDWDVDLGAADESVSYIRKILERFKTDEIDIGEAEKLLKEPPEVRPITCKKSPKGCVSFYGIRSRFPISIYPEDLIAVLKLNMDPEFQEFFAENFPDIPWSGVTEPE